LLAKISLICLTG